MIASEPAVEMDARRAPTAAGQGQNSRCTERSATDGAVPTGGPRGTHEGRQRGRRERAGVALGLASALGCTLGLGACASQHASFPDVPPEQVWTAMKAAALDPSYPDWIVLENAVAIDDSDRTIEIYRQLRRDYVAPGIKPHREDETWKISVALETPAAPKPSEVVFTVRDAALPADSQREANRYFGDVRMLLGLDGGIPAGTRPSTGGSTAPVNRAGAVPASPNGGGAPPPTSASPPAVTPTPSGASPPSTGSPQPAAPSTPPPPPPVDLPQ